MESFGFLQSSTPQICTYHKFYVVTLPSLFLQPPCGFLIARICKMDSQVTTSTENSNPVVFFDITLGGKCGRWYSETPTLRTEILPLRDFLPGFTSTTQLKICSYGIRNLELGYLPHKMRSIQAEHTLSHRRATGTYQDGNLYQYHTPNSREFSPVLHRRKQEFPRTATGI